MRTSSLARKSGGGNGKTSPRLWPRVRDNGLMCGKDYTDSDDNIMMTMVMITMLILLLLLLMMNDDNPPTASTGNMLSRHPFWLFIE